ncbi:hypothetical protein HYH03_006837 [Edaphochlamys debaryana]|uniref:Cytochrome P450 n=1 Tax=Edaphochlamys debaryana TaxID=47281 RepID=A0A835Y489_9CHLO|nr:hypothetical protein HYH03_006837 [Edaphochlamys debaryana]|eukprot:KAG2494902.1 hypothetical protein HYH03_006837 [Edaphochlamys debaryana]
MQTRLLGPSRGTAPLGPRGRAAAPPVAPAPTRPSTSSRLLAPRNPGPGVWAQAQTRPSGSATKAEGDAAAPPAEAEAGKGLAGAESAGREPREVSPVELLLHGGGGAGGSWWQRLIGGGYKQPSSMPDVRVDIGEVRKEPIFALLYRLYGEHGSVFRMSLGPKTFYVVSDPAYVRQILVDSVDKYGKGILAEILEFVMGQSLLTADGEQWAARRRLVAPALQRKFVQSQTDLFASVAARGLKQLQAAADTDGSVDMEAFFSRLSLDVVGLSVFGFDFDSLNRDDPVIQAVYAVLKESEARSTAPLPYWKLPGASLLVPRLRASEAALRVVNDTLDRLIQECRKKVAVEGPIVATPTSSPSVLATLLSSGEDLDSAALRNDLSTLLIAGHETTAAALTWALHCLCLPGSAGVLERLRAEVDSVCGDRLPSLEDVPRLRLVMRVVAEALRLYPQPPVLIRRAVETDQLGGIHTIPAGSDLFISVWNLHRSPLLWERPDEFDPDRFGPLDGPFPSEATTDFRYLPFGGGRRKCVGDQFALAESTVALAVLLRRFEFAPDPSKPGVGLTTGATIHTSAGLWMKVTERDTSGLPPPLPREAAAAGAGADAAAAGCPHAAAAAAAQAAAAAAAGCPHAAAAAAAAGGGSAHSA